MAHRAKHRAAALSRREQRVAEGHAADPSHRERKPRPRFRCRGCATEFRELRQARMHLCAARRSRP